MTSNVGYGIFVQSEGGNGSESGPSAAGAGGSIDYTPAEGLSTELTITSEVETADTVPVVGLYSEGGHGADDNSNNDSAGAPGGAGGAITYHGSGTEVTRLNTTLSPGSAVSGGPLVGIDILSEGGVGGRANEDVGNSPPGGPGGAAGTITIISLGEVSVGSHDAPLITPGQVAGVRARSFGGRGPNNINSTANPSDQGGGGTSTGGDAGNVSVSTQGAIEVFGLPQAEDEGVFGILVQARGGDGGWAYDVGDVATLQDGGPGGLGGDLTVDISADVSVIQPSGAAVDPDSAAILAITEGGTGGLGQSRHNGGPGGFAGNAFVSASGPANVSASGTGVNAIVAQSIGGTGGDGRGSDESSGGGVGGDAGGAAVEDNGNPLTITASASSQGQDSGAGIIAQSIGAFGGRGGDSNVPFGSAGSAGAGGNGSNVEVELTSTATSITTDGPTSFNPDTNFATGILAQSIGGGGGTGGSMNSILGGSDGAGGTGGDASYIIVTNAGVITTAGTHASGILGQSVGGGGGSGGVGGGLVVALGGAGGSGGSSWNVSLTNTGTITTSGFGAIGMHAQSISGSGGNAAVADALVSIGGTAGSAGSTIGTAFVSNTGAISTGGDAAPGILAQAVGGGGGNATGPASSSGGTNYGVVAIGGSGGSGGDGGPVQIEAVGSIRTAGAFSHGAQAQSVGGGGGTGGSAFSANILLPASAAVGGSGSDGGDGASVVVGMDDAVADVATTGLSAHAIIAQSIGGGGGSGGDATGAAVGGLTSVAIGGSSGGGGDGGTVDVTLAASSNLTTQGERAHGLFAQSIGGGGGFAGDASVTDVITAAPVAVGGSGSSGGNGDAVTLDIDGSEITTAGTLANGVLAQSVGGGGGTGGSGTTTSVGFLSIGTAVGGSGGGGGDGGKVELTVNDSAIATATDADAPNAAYGIVAQSVGGGGGVGGVAAAKALTFGLPVDEDTSVSLNVQVAVGGSGGDGGDGQNVQLDVSEASTVSTRGAGSHAILAQSVGGGGGTGGDASTAAISVRTAAQSFDVALTASVGGQGGDGGHGGAVNVSTGAAGSTATELTTTGDHAYGLLAQSIGGGGGNNGVPSSEVTRIGKATGKLDVQLEIGRKGSGGGTSGAVTTDVHGETVVRTSGAGAKGVVAQSIAGGGGTASGGELKIGAKITSEDKNNFSGSLTLQGGQSAGAGGDAGNIQAFQRTGSQIVTKGVNADGVVMQSIGGGGGIAGSLGSAATTRKLQVPTLRLSTNAEIGLGASGGAAGNGGLVSVDQGGAITTSGDWADGIVAQSIGGGGGAGGSASASDKIRAVNFDLVLGGKGGDGGSGGNVDITVFESAVIATSGYQAHGVLGQSIGGGGGQGGDGSTTSQGEASLGIAGGGGGGAGSDGGAVALTNSGTITTAGDGASGVTLQSIGGGGGMAGAGNATSGPNPITFDIGFGGTAFDGASAEGGTVTVTGDGQSITTKGNAAFGLVAQSIGGGGGIAAVAPAVHVGELAVAVWDSEASAAGGDVSVTFGADSEVRTSGSSAHAVIAQSIGGGGGIAGQILASNLGRLSGPVAVGVDAAVSGGDVTVDTGAATISATGDEAIALIAQSVGGGGGLGASEDGSVLFAGTTSSGGAQSQGGNVTITHAENGLIEAPGGDGVAIFAQSVGADTAAGDTDGTITIDISGTVTGGTAGPNAGAGVGIFVSGGSSNNAVNIAETGKVSVGAGGIAIYHEGATDTGTDDDAVSAGVNPCLTITNSGSVTGAVLNQSGCGAVSAAVGARPAGEHALSRRGAFVNARTGHWSMTGRSITSVINAGALSIGTPEQADAASLVGDLTQTGEGALVVDADFVGARGDRLTVDGMATFDGAVEVNTTTIAPDTAVTVVEATTLQGTLEARDSPAVDFEATVGVSSVAVTVADTRIGAAFEVLSANQRSAGEYLDAIFDAGAGPYGAVLAQFDKLSRDGDGGVALRTRSPACRWAALSRPRPSRAPFNKAGSIRC